MVRCAIAMAQALLLAMAPLTQAADCPRLVRVTTTANLRARPSTTARIVGRLGAGEVLTVALEEGEWYLVTTADHPPGYVAKRLVEPVPAPVPPPLAAPEPPPPPPVTAAPAPPGPPEPNISHSPLACVKAEENPLVLADVTSAKTVQKSRVYFKAHQHPDWYYIDMKASDLPHFLAFLPQPLPATEKIDYYLQAFNASLDATRTDQYEPAVSGSGCRSQEPPIKMDRPGAKELTIGGTSEGQSPIPPGFSRKGIVAFVTVAGTVITGPALLSGSSAPAASAATAAAAGAAATGTGGGGLSGTTLAVVGVGVAAAGVGVAVAAGGGGGEDAPPPDPTGFWIGQWTPTYVGFGQCDLGLSLQLSRSGVALSGTATLTVPAGDPCSAVEGKLGNTSDTGYLFAEGTITVPITDGSANGSTVTFTAWYNQPRGAPHTYVGTISGNDIAGSERAGGIWAGLETGAWHVTRR